jgi:sugar phosphate isomerase/epimerase
MYSQAPRLIALAESFGLTIMALQPLNQFDGWPEGNKRAEWARRKAERWLPLCARLGVKLLQVCGGPLLIYVRTDDVPGGLKRSCRGERSRREDGSRSRLARRIRSTTKPPCQNCIRIMVLLEASQHLGAHLGIGANGGPSLEVSDGC